MKFKKPHILAFYLPQYHPTKENNENYGIGFTEWTNVAKAKPLFKGHYQPRVPSELGFYDLRVPEVREQQAELARLAGIDAFCYYDYWMGGGKTLLDYPLREVIKTKSPDFPFCLCWANHSWYKKDWNPSLGVLQNKLLYKQQYLGREDFENHFNKCLSAFKDSRYYKINGKLVYVIYNLDDFDSSEQVKLFVDTWNDLAERNKLPGFYFIAYTINDKDLDRFPYTMFESIILSLHSNICYKNNVTWFAKTRDRIKGIISRMLKRPLMLYKYEDALPYMLHERFAENKVIPELLPNWDLTPRRGAGGFILDKSTPELFKKHAMRVFEKINKDNSQRIVFIKSWNEWGEGNYMEPDLKYGRGYIEALNEAIREIYGDKI